MRTAKYLLGKHFPEFPKPFDSVTTKLDLTRVNLTGIELLELLPHFAKIKQLILAHNSGLRASHVAAVLKQTATLSELDLTGTWNGPTILRLAPDKVQGIKKLRLSGLSGWDLGRIRELGGVSLLDFHDSRPAENLFNFPGSLTYASLKNFLAHPPTGLKQVLLPNLLVDWMEELESVAQDNEISVACLPVYRSVHFPSRGLLVKDGDTLCVNLKGRGLRATGNYRQGFRIKGINTAERHGKNRTLSEQALALAAEERLRELTEDRESLEAFDIEIEKWGRLLGHLKSRGLLVSKILIEEHLAVPYEGENRSTSRWDEVYKLADKAKIINLLKKSEEGLELLKQLP